MKKSILTDGFNEWQNQPEVTGINRLPSTTSFVPYDSEEKAKKLLRKNPRDISIFAVNGSLIFMTPTVTEI